MKPLFIAHRGDTSNFPENTLEAFASAFEHGADGVELDTQLHNGELIVVHNYLYDRDKQYPKLSEVLERFAGKGHLEVEVKSLDLEFLPVFKKLIGQYDPAGIEITTSVQPIVHHLRDAFPEHHLGLIFQLKEFEDWMTEEFVCEKITKYMKVMGGNVAHIPWAVIDKHPGLVKAMHDMGAKQHSHLFKKPLEDELAVYRRFLELGVDQFTCDDIDLLAAVKDASKA
jgi:glycerophosphoryl diester phosphodiesterase